LDNITIQPFKAKHIKQLHDLLNSKSYEGVSLITTKTLPKIGYMVFLGTTPIAAGFLRRLEPCYAQIDTLVSNGSFGSKVRHEGIKTVVDELINEAKRLKLKGIVAHTADKGILERAASLGFHIIPQTVIGLPLLP